MIRYQSNYPLFGSSSFAENLSQSLVTMDAVGIPAVYGDFAGKPIMQEENLPFSVITMDDPEIDRLRPGAGVISSACRRFLPFATDILCADLNDIEHPPRDTTLHTIFENLDDHVENVRPNGLTLSEAKRRYETRGDKSLARTFDGLLRDCLGNMYCCFHLRPGNQVPLAKLDTQKEWNKETEIMAIRWMALAPDQLTNEQLLWIAQNISISTGLVFVGREQYFIEADDIYEGLARVQSDPLEQVLTELFRRATLSTDLEYKLIRTQLTHEDKSKNLLLNPESFIRYFLWMYVPEIGLSGPSSEYILKELSEWLLDKDNDFQGTVKSRPEYKFLMGLIEMRLQETILKSYLRSVSDLSNVSTLGYMEFVRERDSYNFKKHIDWPYKIAMLKAEGLVPTLAANPVQMIQKKDSIRPILKHFDEEGLSEGVVRFTDILPIHFLSNKEGTNYTDIEKISQLRHGIVGNLLEAGWVAGEAPSADQLRFAMTERFGRKNSFIVSRPGNSNGTRLLLNGHHRLAALVSLVADGVLPKVILNRLPGLQSLATTDDILDMAFPGEEGEVELLSWVDVLGFHEESLRLMES